MEQKRKRPLRNVETGTKEFIHHKNPNDSEAIYRIVWILCVLEEN
ncbi:hypothetical protein ACFOZ1_00675 [Gracilibacillus marinus]|uniref:Uncharacterized protein n=1 Tax=Gracilibacillus marinus TaxID=630535 RepID=A0ABV8VQL5_9BACI